MTVSMSGKRRSNAKVAKDNDLKASYVADLSARFSWVQRAEDWDQFMIAEHNRKSALGNADIIKRQLRIAGKAMNIIEKGLDNVDHTKLTVTDITRLMREAAALERVAMGVTEEEQSGEITDFVEFARKVRMAQEIVEQENAGSDEATDG
jgi:hypothetical protein